MVLLSYWGWRVGKALTWLSPTERALLSDGVTAGTCLCLCIYLYVLSAGANIKTSTKITTRLPVVYHINQSILYIQNVGQCHGTHVTVVSLMLVRKSQPSLCICLLNFCMLNSVYAHLLCRRSGILDSKCEKYMHRPCTHFIFVGMSCAEFYQTYKFL
jgi:hypothetical protein